MNMQTIHKSELRPLPMRISQLQFERLQSARGRDGLSVQEHVRRALDHYLAKIEREDARRIPPDPVPDADPEEMPFVNGETSVSPPPKGKAWVRRVPRVRPR